MLKNDYSIMSNKTVGSSDSQLPSHQNIHSMSVKRTEF